MTNLTSVLDDTYCVSRPKTLIYTCMHVHMFARARLHAHLHYLISGDFQALGLCTMYYFSICLLFKSFKLSVTVRAFLGLHCPLKNWVNSAICKIFSEQRKSNFEISQCQFFLQNLTEFFSEERLKHLPGRKLCRWSLNDYWYF